MKSGAKKAGPTDEWRSKTVEERLAYSLVKVGLTRGYVDCVPCVLYMPSLSS